MKRIAHTIRILVSALAFGTGCTAFGAEFHVDIVNGNDNANGLSQSTAFKTGLKAWNEVATANASQPDPAAASSLVHVWPSGAAWPSNTLGTANATYSAPLGTLALIGEGGASVPLYSMSHLKVGADTNIASTLTFTNIDFTIGSPASARRFAVIGAVDSNASVLAATGRVSWAGGSLTLHSGNGNYPVLIGAINTATDAAVYGELDLSGTAGPCALNLGPSSYLRVGIIQNVGSEGEAYGLLDLRTPAPWTLTAYGFECGAGASNGVVSHVSGNILLGSNGTFQVSRYLHIGYNAGCATGIVTVAAGGKVSFEMKSTSSNNLRVGCNCSINAYGVLDLSNVTGPVTLAPGADIAVGYSGTTSYGILDAGNSADVSVRCNRMWIGNRSTSDAYGRITLGRGEGTISETLNIGKDAAVTSENRGLLELNGMELSITGRVSLLRSGAVRVTVDGKSAGLRLFDGTLSNKLNVDAQSLVAADSGIGITFVSPPPGKKVLDSANGADSICWGFKWEGNHVADIETLQASGRLAWDTSALDTQAAAATRLFHDTDDDATYIGFYMRDHTPQGTMFIIK